MQGMTASKRYEVCIEFWLGTLKGRNHSEDLGIEREKY
jgi:hypothetical protein